MSNSDYRHIGVHPVSAALGAEITGVNIAKGLSDEQFEEIRRAFFENLVIMIRDQDLSEEQQCEFAARFGKLTKSAGLKGDNPIFMVTKSADDRGNNIGGHWHADGTQMEHAPLGSALYAMQVPPYGGDTMFCNLYMAYELLSPGMKAIAEQLIVVHSGNLAYSGKGHVVQDLLDRRADMYDFEAGRIDSEHPLVRIIPETGRKVLYAPSPMAYYFKDMSMQDSEPLLRYFQHIAERAEFTCRFRWTKGALLLWDNRATYHYALNDYYGWDRIMRRVQIEGERPFGPAKPAMEPVSSPFAAVRAADPVVR